MHVDPSHAASASYKLMPQDLFMKKVQAIFEETKTAEYDIEGEFLSEEYLKTELKYSEKHCSISQTV
jgi:hypothetical protein